MHKAISIIQFKVEGQIIRNAIRSSAWRTGICFIVWTMERGDISIGRKGVSAFGYAFSDLESEGSLCPYRPEEEIIMERLERAFMNCEKLAAAHELPFGQGKSL